MNQVVGVSLSFAYLIAMIVIGVMVAKWNRTAEDYLVTGREANVLMIAAGAAAFQLAGTTVSGYPADAYTFGWGAAWGAWGWCIANTIFLLLVVKFARRSGTYTSTEWLGALFGPITRLVVAIGAILGLVFSGMGQFVGAGNILAGWTGWSYTTSTFIVGVSTIIYMYTGGMWATMLTDAIQFFIAAGVIYIFLPIFLYSKFGGLEYLSKGPNPLPPQHLRFPIGAHKFSRWLFPSVFGLIWMNITFAVANPYYWQRAVTGRTEARAFRGWIWAVLFVIPFGIVMPLSGMYMHAYLGKLDNPQLVFGKLLGVMPTWLAALIMMGVLAATQSTADANIMGAATIIARDVVPRITKTNEKSLFSIAQWSTLLIGILCMVLALGYKQGALYGLALMSTFIGALLPVLILSFFWRGGTKEGALVGCGVGIIFGLYWGVFSKLWQTVAHPMFLTPLVSLVLFVLVSLISRLTGPWWTVRRKSVEVTADRIRIKEVGEQGFAMEASEPAPIRDELFEHAKLFYMLSKPWVKIPAYEKWMLKVFRNKNIVRAYEPAENLQ
ncbi:MAG TPA: sodium:solute symporter family protein [Firmicutes bacterium]|nr:sodium:solute symporter family protein [Bacillota bacterium]